jgi:hypothetical protein
MATKENIDAFQSFVGEHACISAPREGVANSLYRIPVYPAGRGDFLVIDASASLC